MKLRWKIIIGAVIVFYAPAIMTIISGHTRDFLHCEGSTGVYVEIDRTGEGHEVELAHDFRCNGR